MTRDQKEHHLNTWVAEMQSADARIQPVIDALRLDGGDPVCDTVWRLQSALTAAYSHLVGDVDGWLSWFACENDFGRRGMEAGPKDGLRPIRGVPDLLWLLEVCA